MPLVPSCGWIVQLVCLSNNGPGWLLETTFFFSPEGSTIAQNGNFFLACRFWLIFHVFSWSTSPHSHCCPQEWPQKLPAEPGEVWVWHLACWGCPWARWEDPWVRFSQQLMGGLSAGVQNAVSRNCVSLTPLDICICHFPNLLPTPLPTPYQPILKREMGERWVFSAAPCTAKKLDADTDCSSLFSTGEISGVL